MDLTLVGFFLGSNEYGWMISFWSIFVIDKLVEKTRIYLVKNKTEQNVDFDEVFVQSSSGRMCTEAFPAKCIFWYR